MKNDHIQIQDMSDCCGCGACVNVCPKDAISFFTDEFGFSYPRVNDDICINCRKCLSVCPLREDDNKTSLPAYAYAATHRDKDTLKRSSSGGVFSAVAEYVLERGGAVCGCIFDKNLRAIHICSENYEDITLMRKSKYVQSEVGFVYREVAQRLDNEQMVLFTGTPCQIAALYKFLGAKKSEKLITMDLICHGVPSQLMFKKYIEYLENKYGVRITKFDFRSKKYGWQRFTTSYTDTQGLEKNLGKVNEFYIPAFTGGNIIRTSCFACKYACPERVGDITVGDLWGHEKLDLPKNFANGISLCTLNTERALELKDFLSERLFMQEIDYQIAINGNRCLHEPTEKGSLWEDYMLALKRDDISSIARRYIRKHKKTIMRNSLKMLVPYAFFSRIRKKKYR